MNKDFILEFAAKAGKIPGVKMMFRPVFSLYKQNLINKRNKLFRKNAIEALNMFHKALSDINVNYTLAFGTMLGAVREGGFIKHDLDIDVAIWNEDYSPMLNNILSKYGFRRTHVFNVENGTFGREETYEYKGVGIDIFYFYIDSLGNTYCCDFLAHKGCATFNQSMKEYGSVIARKLILPLEKEVRSVNFEGIETYIPFNAEKILEFRYGPDYMIPNPSWSITSYDKHITILDDKIAKYLGD